MALRFLVLVVVTVLVLGGLFVLLRPDAPGSSPEARSFDVEIQDGSMSPEEISVREGDRVSLNVSADQPAEIHFHGYNIETKVGPDEPAEFSFEADTTGRFPVENHDSGAELGFLVVEPR